MLETINCILRCFILFAFYEEIVVKVGVFSQMKLS